MKSLQLYLPQGSEGPVPYHEECSRTAVVPLYPLQIRWDSPSFSFPESQTHIIRAYFLWRRKKVYRSEHLWAGLHRYSRTTRIHYNNHDTNCVTGTQFLIVSGHEASISRQASTSCKHNQPRIFQKEGNGRIFRQCYTHLINHINFLNKNVPHQSVMALAGFVLGFFSCGFGSIYIYIV